MTEYLELFLWNLLLGEKNELRNRTMHINGKSFVAEETNIGFGKADIEAEKADIGTEKAEIDKWRVDMLPDISDKTVGHIEILFEKEVFGRTGVESTTGLRSTRASELLKLLVERGLVENVKGQGKAGIKRKTQPYKLPWQLWTMGRFRSSKSIQRLSVL